MVELSSLPPARPSAFDDAPKGESPSAWDSGLGDPLNHDEARLRLLIQRHHELTGSARAAALLADWSATLAAFVKITPKDYKRALLQLAAERQRDREAVAA